MSRERQFLGNLELIERIIASVCNRHHLRGADREDFASSVKLKLIENDYRVFAVYEGRSELGTYLNSVIQRIYFDFQIKRFGKWRTSAEARRLGPTAVHLERLVYRDHLSFDEACEVLCTNYKVAEGGEELYDLWQKLPPRTSRRSDGTPEPPERTDDRESAEESEQAARLEAALCRALCCLPARDFLLLRLHWDDGQSVANISRSLNEDQDALYRRLGRIVAALGRDLAEEGISGEDFRELTGRLDWDVFSKARAARDQADASRPSNPPDAKGKKVGNG